MTIEQLWSVRCDWCGSFLLESVHEQRDHAIREAKKAGWQLAIEYNGFMQDLCPDCDHEKEAFEKL